MPLFFLLIFSVAANCQKKDTYFVYDAEMKPTVIENAQYLLHKHRINDTCWQFDFYHFTGPMIKSEQYRTNEGDELDGVCYIYSERGILDSVANFRRGKKNGDSWKLSRDSLQYKMKYVYLDDSLVDVIDLTKIKKDSTTAVKDESESEYPGGLPAWGRYLTKHLEYPQRAMNLKKEGMVIIGFMVDPEGAVTNPYIARSIEYSLDEEALKIIKASGKWEAATQHGQVVKSYKTQPINFRLE